MPGSFPLLYHEILKDDFYHYELALHLPVVCNTLIAKSCPAAVCFDTGEHCLNRQ